MVVGWSRGSVWSIANRSLVVVLGMVVVRSGGMEEVGVESPGGGVVSVSCGGSFGGVRVGRIERGEREQRVSCCFWQPNQEPRVRIQL